MGVASGPGNFSWEVGNYGKVYVISFLYSKCSTFKAAWVCGQSYASISHNPTKCA